MRNTVKSLFLICSLLFSYAGFAQNPAQKVKDDKIIKSYLTQHKIKATKTASGLYYIITRKGSGENAKVGQHVSMAYFGKFLDGKKFDANVDEHFKCNRPYTFALGTGSVIPGWDEGIQLLNPGSKATFYLPSSIGYGDGGRGPIPPSTVLVFDVELLSASN